MQNTNIWKREPARVTDVCTGIAKFRFLHIRATGIVTNTYAPITVNKRQVRSHILHATITKLEEVRNSRQYSIETAKNSATPAVRAKQLCFSYLSACSCAMRRYPFPVRHTNKDGSPTPKLILIT